MTALMIDLPAEVYHRLLIKAQQQQKPVEVLASEWLAERSIEETPHEQTEKIDFEGLSNGERAVAVLRAAGMLVEPSPEERKNKPLTPEERDRVAAQVPPGRSLADIIIEERGEA